MNLTINTRTLTLEIQSNSLNTVDPFAFKSLRGGISFLQIMGGGINEIPIEALNNVEFSCKNGGGPGIGVDAEQISSVPVGLFETLMRKIGCPFSALYLGMK